MTGFKPDPQGEANYGTELFRRVAANNPREVDVHVFAHVGGPPTPTGIGNLHVHRVTGGSRLAATARVAQLWSRLNRYTPEVAHFQGIHTPLYGGTFGEATLPVLHAVRAHGGKTVVTLHSTWTLADLNELWQGKGLPRAAVRAATTAYSAYLRALARVSDVIRVAVAGAADELIASFLAEHRIVHRAVIAEPHPCEPKFVSADGQRRAKAQLGLQDRIVVLAAGFVRRDKSLHRLIDTAAQLHDDHRELLLIIAGEPVGRDGIEYAAEMTAQATGCSAVRLDFRFLSDAELGTYMDAADVVAVPYGRVIGPSGPIHMALSRGKAVLATATGHNLGLKDVIALYRSEESELSDALRRMLVAPQRIGELTAKAREYAAHHTWDSMAAEYMQQYRELLGRSE